jgi:hypothetical protein
MVEHGLLARTYNPPVLTRLNIVCCVHYNMTSKVTTFQHHSFCGICEPRPCLAQHAPDAEYQIHWSRHPLACIREITAAQLQRGAKAVAYNQHFSFFVSPFSSDRWLGAVTEWPPVTTLFTPDSYAPAARRDQWQKIATHQVFCLDPYPRTIMPILLR